MRYRVAFAVGFVALVGGLILLRDAGYLGGREAGGPFELQAAGDGVSGGGPRNRISGFGLFGELKGDPVRVQNVRPRIVSPELEVLGPNLYRGRCGVCGPRHWPPRRAGVPLEDALVKGPHQNAIIGLRAQRAGLYYAIGLIVDYRRGQRRFRDREAQELCIAVQTKQECDLDYEGPGDARVAQVGGPSRYPDSKLSREQAEYTKPGEYRLRIAVANQTRSAIDVSKLAFDKSELRVELVASAPASFHLPPRGYRVVRLRVRLPGCRDRGSANTFDRLRADLDGSRRSIPLSLPLTFGCPPRPDPGPVRP